MAKAMFRVSKGGGSTNKWSTIKKQDGASGRIVFTADSTTYNRGRNAAASVLSNRALSSDSKKK